MRKIFLALFTTTLLSGCTLLQLGSPKIEQEIIEISHHNYFEVEDKAVTWTKVFNIENNSYFLYYYSPSCSHCAELKDFIIEKALERGDIYFVKSSENDVIAKDVSSTIGATTSEQIAIVGYPSMIQIVNKIVTKNVAGKSKITELLK